MDFSAVTIDDIVFGSSASNFGPSETQPSFGAQFDGRLFKPYNKRDKLGKIIEFSMSQASQVLANPTQAQQNAMKKQVTQTNANNQLVEAAEDGGFTNVEDKGKAKQEKKRSVVQQSQAQKAKAKVQQAEDKAYLTANFQGPQQTKKRQQWAAQVAKANNQSQQSQQVSMSWSKRGIRELSFEPKNEWEIVEDFSKQGFEKLKPLTPEFVSCEVEAGKLFAFDNAWTKVKMLKFKKIPQFKGLVPNEATTRDSIIQQLAQDGKANIFATDIAAAALMTSSKAAFSWDLVIKKFEGLLFIDKRDDENILDWQTVSETAGVEFQPLDEEGVNGVRYLMKEAARTQNDFLACMQGKACKELTKPDPFEENEDQVICHQGYYYNIWKLDSDTKICIRSAVHSYNETTNEKMNCFVLPEWSEKRQNWLKDLDLQTAVCLTKEISDNASKFCRWTVQSLLAQVEKMRFAFVQRADAIGTTHKAVGSYTTDTQAFAKQLGLSIENCWATLKEVVDTVLERDEVMAEFLYLKDLNPQPVYRLFKMIEEEDAEDEEDDSGL